MITNTVFLVLVLSFALVPHVYSEDTHTTRIPADPSIPDGFARIHWANKFRAAGIAAGTDKTGWHNYEFVYGKYFAHDSMHLHREKKVVRMLEIGLGCNMGYGPGKSVALWKSWFPYLDLHEMEYDVKCVEKWQTELDKLANVTVHVGDQSKQEDLDKLLLKAKVKPGKEPWLLGENQFDIIIDDGGHYFNQIKLSYEVLFEKALKPGGLYVIEDIAPMRVPYPGREYNDGQVIQWLQGTDYISPTLFPRTHYVPIFVVSAGMMATLLGNAGQEPHSRFSSDPMNMHAPQARWVASVEAQKNAAAIIKVTAEECKRTQAYCPSIN
jgi:hypothetical protein